MKKLMVIVAAMGFAVGVYAQTAKPADAAKIAAPAAKVDDKSAPAANIPIPESAYRARIDVDGMPGKIAMKPVKNCNEADWMKDDKIYRMTSDSGPLKDTEWKAFEISFTPEKDGNVSLVLMGQYFVKPGEKAISPTWVLFDDVKVTGTELKNGNFSELDDKGKPKLWGGSGELVDVKNPDSGKAIRVWHNQGATQLLAVKAGQTVTVTAKVQKAKQ